MTSQILTLEELKQQPVEKILMDVVNQHMIFIIRLPGGDEVSIEPKPQLKPLPVLNGYVPEGWKDVIYSQTREL